jgi:hypothetical protein
MSNMKYRDTHCRIACSNLIITANKSLLHVLKMSHVFNIVLRYKDVMQRDIMIEPSVM